MYKTKVEIKVLDNKLDIGSLLTLKDGVYKDSTGYFMFDQKTLDSNTDSFEKVLLNIQEIASNDEDIQKNWRIQLDLKCSSKRLKEIQTFLEANLNKIMEK